MKEHLLRKLSDDEIPDLLVPMKKVEIFRPHKGGPRKRRSEGTLGELSRGDILELGRAFLELLQKNYFGSVNSISNLHTES